jgi:hypothetical protein
MKFSILPELELTDLNAQKITRSCGWLVVCVSKTFVNSRRIYTNVIFLQNSTKKQHKAQTT